MRDHPEGIRSVILDSVLPTNYTVAANWQNARDGFDNLFQACAAETACDAAHPRLEEAFTGLVNKLEAEPLTTTVSDPATGKDLKVLLDGGALIDWLRNQNYGVPTLRAAPDRIDGLAASRPEAVEAIALDRASRAPPSGPGIPALGYGLALGETEAVLRALMSLKMRHFLRLSARSGDGIGAQLDTQDDGHEGHVSTGHAGSETAIL